MLSKPSAESSGGSSVDGVDVERQQIADRVGVLGAVQAMRRRRARDWDARPPRGRAWTRDSVSERGRAPPRRAAACRPAASRRCAACGSTFSHSAGVVRRPRARSAFDRGRRRRPWPTSSPARCGSWRSSGRASAAAPDRAPRDGGGHGACRGAAAAARLRGQRDAPDQTQHRGERQTGANHRSVDYRNRRRAGLKIPERRSDTSRGAGSRGPGSSDLPVLPARPALPRLPARPAGLRSRTVR